MFEYKNEVTKEKYRQKKKSIKNPRKSAVN